MKKQLQFTFIAIIALTVVSYNSSAQSIKNIWANSSAQSNSIASPILSNDVYGITTDASGNTYITGSFATDTIVFGGITLLRASVTKTNADFFIAKYNSSGTVLWAKGVGGNGASSAGASNIGQDNEASGTGVAVDREGNVYVTGYFESDSVVFGNFILTTAGGTISSASNIFIVKYDSSGKVIWAREAGESDPSVTSAGIATDANANVYITGSYDGAGNAMVLGGITLKGNGFMLAKYDSSGNIIWAKTAQGGLSTSSVCTANNITTDASGNVFVIGTFFGDTTTFSGGVTLQNTLGGVSSIMYVVKFDSSGNSLWAQTANIGIKGQGFNGETIGGVNGLATDTKGNLYVTGGFYNATVAFGSTTLTNYATGGFDNMFLVKYSASGSVLWAQSAVQPTGDDDAEGLGVSTDANGNAFVSGAFASTYIKFGSNNLIGSSSETIFLTEYDSTGDALAAIAAGGGGYQIDEGVGVKTDNTGNVYVTGIFDGSLNFGNNDMSSGPQQGLYVAKFNGSSSGINQLAVNSDQLSIYPNPNNGNFILHLQNINRNTQVQIFDVLGQKIYEADLNSTTTQLNLSDEPKGIYLYRVLTTDGEFVGSGKVVVE